jgi:cytochrome P450
MLHVSNAHQQLLLLLLLLLLPVSIASLQVVSQLNTFLVAAFETTASAIACCIYFIAQHPEVQAALLQEVDSFGSSRQVTYSDLDQVR